MEGHDVVVIGASAGGVQALIELISRLPADLPASIFVVLHMATAAPSALPLILSRHSALPLAQAVEGESIVPGRVYIARPDYHLLIEDGHVRLGHGPKEHHTRPALDPLFRTAAEVYGRRVVGVVLTGARSNGALGLLAVKEHGGVAMVQQPDEALWPSMPLSAMRTVRVDYVLPLSQLAPRLVELVLDPPAEGTVATIPAPGKEARRCTQEVTPKGTP
jgi:two-component system chemotaxis response regulator CheB